MATCFVIQPFDNGKFDKRYADTFRPAIEEAGLEPYRVDHDLSVEVPIDAIEDGIRNASICLADITTNNPNVWYELGYAFAAGKPIVMVCSAERAERRYPFDIQHRTVISYSTESASDFSQLQVQIKERLLAQMKKGARLREVAESNLVAAQDGLSQPELAVLASLAGDAILPDTTRSLYNLKHDVDRAGFTSMAFILGVRKLARKGLIETGEGFDEREGEPYPVAKVTPLGWQWVEANERLFSLTKGRVTEEVLDDEIPF